MAAASKSHATAVRPQQQQQQQQQQPKQRSARRPTVVDIVISVAHLTPVAPALPL